jgi:hypothetical protein
MVNETPTMVRCTACGTEFSSTDTAEAKNHIGHPLEHIEQG